MRFSNENQTIISIPKDLATNPAAMARFISLLEKKKKTSGSEKKEETIKTISEKIIYTDVYEENTSKLPSIYLSKNQLTNIDCVK